MVLEIEEPDMSLYPFRRMGAYLLIVVPYAILMAAAFVFLLLEGVGGKAGRKKPASALPALVYLAFYLGMCYFQAYCCRCQECPYVGEKCPAIAGIYPANLLAGFLYGESTAKSERRLRAYATLAGLCWGGIIVFPLYRLAKRNRALAAGYLAAHAVYYSLHGLLICPACAIKDTCPGGTLQRMARFGG